MENALVTQGRNFNNLPAVKSNLPITTIAGQVDPSDCGCGGGGGAVPPPPAIVYALGTIGYDFGSESHRDSFVQSMGNNRNPHNPADLIAYIRENPWAASEILWTLNIDATPIYALYPSGPYSNVVFERLVNSLEEQQNGNIQRVSVPWYCRGAQPPC
jgi:hypothetical protein